MNVYEENDTLLARRGIRSGWSDRTTTTLNFDDDTPEVSISSQAPPASFLHELAVAWITMQARKSASLHLERLLPETAAQLIFFDEDTFSARTRVTSDALYSCFAPGYKLLKAPTATYEHDVLNWEAAIDVAPPRPSGKISVILRNAGRGGPSPVSDPWE